MSALFPPASNTLARVTLSVLALVVVGGPLSLGIWVRSPMARGEREWIEQPIEFDHRHHTADEGIDCRYCHREVERSRYAGVPPTELCLNCHSQVWNRSPLLEVVRVSWASGRPIEWTRVHDLPDFVYFEHSIHVAKGVGCVTCHGRVDQMPVVEQVRPLSMAWCLDCHRDPTPHLRPLEEITTMRLDIPVADRAALARELGVEPRTNCYTCHR